MIAHEEVRGAVEKIVNDTGNAPSFDVVYKTIVSAVSQKYKHDELLNHGECM